MGALDGPAGSGVEERLPCCKRSIHTCCLQEWVETSCDARCPYCRANLSLPQEQLTRLEKKRKLVKEVDEANTSSDLRRRMETAQQIFDVYSASHRTHLLLDPDVVWKWCMDAELTTVAKMLQNFEKWYQEEQEKHHRITL